MKKLITLSVLVFLVSISFSQTSFNEVLSRSKVIVMPGFKEYILPYININLKNSSNNERMHVESHILPYDMNIEDMITTFGVRALEAGSMVSLLTNALVSGQLKGINLTKQNIFIVLVNHGSYDTGYIVDLFWSPSHSCWALNAHPMERFLTKKGVQLFNSY